MSVLSLTRRYIIAAAAVVGIIFIYFAIPVSAWWVPKCPFKLLTGLSCPACGIQRSLHALFNGHPLEAIRYNYYLAYSLPYASLFLIRWLMPCGEVRERLTRVIENRYVVWFYVWTFVIWLVVRNILGI